MKDVKDDPYWKLPIITIHNRHSAACGKPPVFQEKDLLWFSFWLNGYGEQFFFVVTKERKCILYSGDAGWEKPHEIEVRPLDSIAMPFCTASTRGAQIVYDVASNQPLLGFSQEAEWICACWNNTEYERTGEVRIDKVK